MRKVKDRWGKIAGKCVLFGLAVLLVPCILTLLFSGKTYKGEATTAGDYSFISDKDGNSETMSLNTYIMGALAANIDLGSQMETLKAQAVIIRTYAYLAMEAKSYGSKEINVKEIGLGFMTMAELKNNCKEGEYMTYVSNLENAVYSTDQFVLTYEDKLITPLFHDCNTGVTRGSLSAAGKELPYLISVDSTEDVASTEAMKIVEEEISIVIGLLQEKYQDISLTKENFFDKVQIIERDDYNYVTKVQIDTITITGENFAQCLDLNSSDFTMENYEGKVRFVCIGKGHGFGFSQFGANEKVKKGATYQEVLQHYYTGTILKNMQIKEEAATLTSPSS